MVSYFLYWTYQLYQYGEIPISKKDVMLRCHPRAFRRTTRWRSKGADLLGFGEKFLVAYGNRRFVGKAFAMDDQVIERLERNQGRTNLPLVKVFYIAEPGLLSSLLNLSPFLDIQKNMVELSLGNTGRSSWSPSIRTRSETARAVRNRLCLPQLFSLSQLEVADYDGDGRDELRLGYLSYAGGSGGTRWSVIYDLKDGALDRPFRLSGNARHRRRPVHPGGQPVRRPRRHLAARPASLEDVVGRAASASR